MLWKKSVLVKCAPPITIIRNRNRRIQSRSQNDCVSSQVTAVLSVENIATAPGD